MVSLNGDSQTISFRTPRDIKNAFCLKVRSRGKRSRILRGLLQMWLEGKIPEITYKQEDKISVK